MKSATTIVGVLATTLALGACQPPGTGVGTAKGSGNNPVDACSQGHPNLSPPSIVYKIYVNTGFQFQDADQPSIQIVTKAAKLINGAPNYPSGMSSYWDEDPDGVETPYTPPPPATGEIPTPFDISTSLKQKNDSALIKVVVIDGTIDWLSGADAARDGKPGGSQMFCDLVRPANQKVGKAAIVRVHYPDGSQSKQHWQGSINWGWMVSEPNQKYLPIYVDPSVDNDG
jgi:hypothetical protein